MRDQQSPHLITNTPMKLLTTIAAVLISISAYSQDLIEYENYSFSRNGESLTMEEIEGLTKRFRVAERILKAAKKNVFDEENYNNNKSVNVVVTTGVLYTILGIYQVSLKQVYVLGEGYKETKDYPGIVLMAIGAGMFKFGHKIYSSPEDNYFYNSYKRNADILFNKVADKINQAIAAEGPTAQSSNQ